MTIALWCLNTLLALGFLAAGGTKLIRSKPALHAQGMTFVDDFSAPAVKAIGAAEVAGALGLVLPLATDVLPILTPLAAAGLVALMIGAGASHVRRGESPAAAVGLGAASVASAVVGTLVVLG
ncbi:DoxX family protein [Streptomyces bohaiensis]|uniref:DoxX family protein n=1 Tax=Streptomyces bohaiensis TaxID=1431344 RepID=A0ABX1CA18_9ACTN|nr:DoxX family protein [Streptomyces bohaiensis]NJQ14092.1 DoxX family protein [Streptomyces bohaiensis]